MADGKPQFDPSKPFEVVQHASTSSSKPPFDPSRPFEHVGGESTPEGPPSQLESALRGGIQGLGANFEDEAVGALGAGGNAVMHPSELSLDHLKQKYQEYRDLERSRNKAAEEANPGTYGTANLAGAIGQGFMLPAGAFGTITKGAPALMKILQAAGIGAKAAALPSLGASNADLTEGKLDQATNDVIHGVGTGAQWAGGLQGLVGSLGATGKIAGSGIAALLNRYSPTKVITKATQKGLQGKYLGDLQQPLGQLEGATKDLAKKALDVKSSLQQEYTDILSDAEASGSKADLSDFLGKLKELKDKYAGVKDPEVQNELNVIENTVKNYTEGMPQRVAGKIERTGGSPELGAKDVFDLQKLVGEKTANKLETSTGKQFGKSVDSALSSEAEKAIPELPGINKRYSAMSKALDILGLDSNDALVKNVKSGELELSPQVFGKIQQYIKANAEDSLSRNKAEQGLNLVMDNLDAAGLNTDKIRNLVQEAGENFDIAKDITGKGLHSRLPIANIKNLAYLGNTLGYAGSKVGDSYSKYAPTLLGAEAQKQATETVNKPTFVPDNHSVTVNNEVQQGNNVYATGDAELQTTVQRLKQLPGMENRAAALEHAITSGNKNQKNAIIFSLMQNPNTRKLLEVDRVK